MLLTSRKPHEVHGRLYLCISRWSCADVAVTQQRDVRICEGWVFNTTLHSYAFLSESLHHQRKNKLEASASCSGSGLWCVLYLHLGRTWMDYMLPTLQFLIHFAKLPFKRRSPRCWVRRWAFRFFKAAWVSKWCAWKWTSALISSH